MRLLAFVVLIAAAASSFAAPEQLDNFRLLDAGSHSWELYRARESKAVVLCTVAGESPESKAALEAMTALAAATPDAKFFALDVAPGPAAPVAGGNALAVPILRDTAQDISRDLGATVVGEVFIALPAQAWKIVHHGTIATLGEALRAVLSAQVPAPAPAPTGVPMPMVASKSYDYANDVAPVLAAKCLSCHTKDGVGPFAFTGYASAKKWSRMTREVLRTAQMPPWHADPHYGKFSAGRALSTEERQAILGWIAQGSAPAPDGRDPLSDAAAAMPAAGWAMGEPDLVLQLPEPQKLPAEGVVPYRYITVPTGLTEDQWVRGFEVKPTALSAVHHALIFVIYPKEYRHLQPEAEGGLEGYFAAYLPGQAIKPYPDDMGQFLPKGSALIFQMHYNTNGKEAIDQTKIGLYFQKTRPDKALNIVAASDTEFYIPANAPDHPVFAQKTFKEGVELWGLSPHMHYRGGRARFDLTTPSGEKRTLLNVPFYDFDWQPLYIFEAPIPLPASSLIEVSGAFDNSKFNPKNPDPNLEVYFGEQSYEEMYIGYMAVTEPASLDKYAPHAVDSAQYLGDGQPLTADTLVGTRWLFEDQEEGQAPETVELALHRFGIAMVGGIPGTWSVANGTVTIGIPFDDPFPLTLVNDELFWTGLPLKRLK